MTEETRTSEEDRHRPTLGDLSHTHPVTGARFGDTQAYERGPAVAADGGERERASEDAERAGRTALRDVDHEPPGDGGSVQNVHDRGTEGRANDV